MPKTINTAIEAVALSLLKPHPRNVNQGDFGAIQQSVETNGFYGTIVANKRTGHILAGNHRYAVAKQLGFADVPVAWVDVDDEEELRILIADNRTTRLGIDNEERLAELLAELSQTPEGLLGTGFDGDDLDHLIGRLAGESKELLGDPDEVPEPPADPITKPGDLWILGDHRVLCGDSTKAEDVARLMNGEILEATITDPPYGINYQSNFRNEKFGKLENDDRILSGWVSPSMRNSHGWIIFFCPWQRLDEWMAVGREIGSLTNLLIWKKAAAMGDLTGAFAPTFEVALAYNRGAKLLCEGRPSAVLEHRIDSGVTFEHPTTKPVGLFTDILRATTDRSVYDPFLGSGTTLIAAEQLGRRCYGMEISPQYCDVIVTRWETLTGKTAVLEGKNGETN